MKQAVFFLIFIVFFITSCNDLYDIDLESSESVVFDDHSHTEYVLYDTLEIDQRALKNTVENMVLPRTNQSVFYNLTPTQSCPGEDALLFLVLDWGVDEPYAVRLISPYGNEYFIPLVKYGNFQYRYLILNTPGRWEFEYVHNSTHNPAELIDELYYKDMTGVEYDGNSALLSWPFVGYSDWVMTCGYGCGAHTSGNGEYYAQDWAKNGGCLGETMASPFDGVVSHVGYAPSTYGNYVDVKQEIGEYELKFRVAHLQTVGVSVNQIVFAGQTLLGTIGSTGNSSGAHAHCVVYDITNSQYSVPFDWNAECQGGLGT